MNDVIKQQQTNKCNDNDHCYMTKQKCLYIVKNCTGSLDENRIYHWKTSYSYTKQSWNLSGPMVYIVGISVKL